MSAECVIDESGSLQGRRHASGRSNPPPMSGAALSLAAVLACSMAGVGCKSGMSMTKPSWWSFGGGGGDTAKLAAAPAFSGDTKKPSESNSPYPTTSTPNGYVITGSAAPGSAAATPAAQAAAPVGPVVYGSTPPPTAAPAAGMAVTAPAATQPGVVAAQTGPYATLAGETIPPPGQPLPPIAPISASPSPAASAAIPSAATTLDSPAAGAGYSNFSSGATAATATEPPAARMADARAFDPAPVAPPAGLPPEAAAAGYGTGRYATQSASRFSSGGSTAASSASYGQPPADAGFPPADAALPANSPPAGAPVAQPGLLPQSPSQPPVRRPDPGYRPFKTGSYRPSGAILADDAPPAPAAVRTASYEEPAATAIQR